MAFFDRTRDPAKQFQVNNKQPEGLVLLIEKNLQ